VFQVNVKATIGVGDYVLTEGDRGIDVGRVIAVLPKPPARRGRSPKMILRPATQREVEQLPQKLEREAAAVGLAQTKVLESGLPMVITDAEFQFDGKKLTLYFSASEYIDFRVLVKNLFKVFATRIWMIWNEGEDQRERAAPA
jgi:cell fate regulator YaaT (PSP1 superfamily)